MSPAAALAQSHAFPGRAVRIIVPYGPGGNADVVMRLLDGRLTELTGQNIVRMGERVFSPTRNPATSASAPRKALPPR